MEKELQQIKETILEEVKKIKDSQVLRDLELKYLGRKGELTTILRGLTKLDGEDKKKVGALANTIKNEIYTVFKDLKSSIEEKGREEFVDVTLPGKKSERGHLHPITLIQNELEDVFSSMGFMVLGSRMVPRWRANIIILRL